jgi:uncharacterized protein (DUF1501 family)
MRMSLPHPAHPVSRREVIQAGAVGLLGLGMNHLSALQAMTAATHPARAQSVIYIFLSGGLAQHESFDMKPDAPMEIRGEFKPIRTRTPGLHICEHLPNLARISEKWSLVRSLTHGSSDHSLGHHIMLTGRTDAPLGFDPSKPKKSDHPSMAALATALLPKRKDNLPPAIVLPEKLVHREGRTLAGQFAGTLGAQHDPWFLEMSPYHPKHYGAYPKYLFHHERGFETDPSLHFQAPHLSLPQGLTMDRVMDRVSLRNALEQQTNDLTALAGDETFDSTRQAAIGLLSNRKVHDAFSLEKVDPKMLDRYGRNSFGWSLLMARRLVQSGVRMVQVNLGNSETWDTHQAAWGNLKNYLLPPMDQAVSALLEDLDASGQLDETLIVMGGEFGRTPKIKSISATALPGRDHWGHAQSILLAGGGIKGGRLIGATDKQGGYPVSDAQTPENLAATIYEALGLPNDLMWHDFTGRPHTLYMGSPIRGLT